MYFARESIHSFPKILKRIHGTNKMDKKTTKSAIDSNFHGL